MTDLLDQAFRIARELPPAEQDAVARMILQFFGSEPSLVELTPEEEEAVTKSEAAEARGEYATDDEVRAVWAKYGL